MLLLQHTDDMKIEVGIDEAGRGSLWGPLVAAAVIWTPEMTAEQSQIAPLIKDSKKLSAKVRTKLATAIKDHSISWGIGHVTAAEIDQLGITKANQLSFTRALENLSVIPERILIDGCISIYDAPWSMIDQVVEPEADNRYISVAAASILAKTEHDSWVEEFCERNTNIAERYDLISCKGYGTARHRAGVLQWGEDRHHRKLFLRKLYGS